MTLIRHCIIDTTTNTVVNIIDYETEQNGVPPSLENHFLCVASNDGQIGGIYENGVITNPKPAPLTEQQIADNEKLQAVIAAKESALAKLAALGLTQDEISALVG